MAAGNDTYGIVANQCANCLVVGSYKHNKVLDKTDDIWSCGNPDNPEDWDLEKPDVVASGSGIETTVWRRKDEGGYTSENAFETVSGTSLAAPMVASLAADMIARFPQLKGKQEAIRALIKLNAKQTLKQQSTGGEIALTGLQNEKTGTGRIDGLYTFLNQTYIERVPNILYNRYYYYGSVNHNDDFIMDFTTGDDRFNNWPQEWSVPFWVELWQWLFGGSLKQKFDVIPGNRLKVPAGKTAKTILTWNYTNPGDYPDLDTAVVTNFDLCYTEEESGGNTIVCSEKEDGEKYIENNTEYVKWKNNTEEDRYIYIQLYRKGTSDIPRETIAIITDAYELDVARDIWGQ